MAEMRGYSKEIGQAEEEPQGISVWLAIQRMEMRKKVIFPYLPLHLN